MNFKRIAFILLPIASATSGLAIAAPEAATAEWQFDVSLDGKPIGTHTFELNQQGEQKVLTTEARFDVKFLFVTAFRYRHQNTEVWNNDCLKRIDASTNSNGKELVVSGEATEGGFSLQSANGSRALPSCVQTFAYWNPSVLEAGQLLNSQTGVYEDVSITLEGRDLVPVAGNPVEALRYRLSAQAGDITLWYASADNTWLGLEAPAKGGRKIRYQAVAVPESRETPQLIARNN